MPAYNIRGINVDFPFEAYDCQLVYMEKVIQSLQERCNALLESPTGTGKTLCLLCATLAWRKSLGGFSTGTSVRSSQNEGSESDVSLSQSVRSNLPTIIYTSRTHSQIRQVIQELKRTSYRPKMVVLGSREQLCIHDEVSLLRGKAQTNACHLLCRKREKRNCVHYSRVADYMKKNPHLGDEPIDIEDLVNVGRRFGPCPYYVSRELHKTADILFAPYNYLIDRGYRKFLSLDWNNSILIFDEAHNLESLCADAASFDLPSWLLNACISEAKNCIELSTARREEANDKSRNPDSFAILRALLLKLEKQIAEVPIQTKELGFTRPGPYIYELLADLNITHETASKLINIIDDAAVLLEEDSQHKAARTVCRLESIRDILNIIFRDKGNAHANFYRVHVQEVEASAADGLKGKVSRTLSWWCFNPGIALEAFPRLGVGSVILTSGTLSPMASFAQELKLEFPVRLENPHVINPSQIWAGVVPTGPSGYSFNSSYRTRECIEYKQELGNAIVNFARIVPDGLLVFFPSYYILDQCIGCWKNMSHANSTTIWERICKHKKPVVEPRQSSLFATSIEDYMATLKDTSASGAVFFAVCRGKVSEGLDFADHAGRAVIVTGMPFATTTDPKVRLKREYLDQEGRSQSKVCKVLTGEDWYNQQALRAVNQAVGRVIRHRHDYGAIIFCDERFAQPYRQSQISLWIQPHVKCYSKFGDVVFTLTRFFRDGGARVSTDLRPVQTENRGEIEETQLEQPLEKFLPQMTPMRQDSSVKALSSILDIKRGNASGQVGEVLPANRSSLTPFKNQSFVLKHLNDPIGNVKKLLMPGRKNMQYQDPEIIDLTGYSLLDEQLSKDEELIAPCSARKRKLLSTENVAMQKIEVSHEHSSDRKTFEINGPSFCINPAKPESSQTSGTIIAQNAQVGSPLLHKEDGTSQKREVDFLRQKNKGFDSIPVLSGNEETRGSNFLIQVKEKLTAEEYKNFVEFMKALKSKTMKISQVLQSIVGLFSGPERLPLLKRFKDYIPAKYHSLYEQYLETNDGTL
ncbi:regulator of telomere elongation helicase 1 homolog [Corylus avellana]|uniref:regulator of telomere elongation helicase 1 homolog n=1 Tax=Corylus avellana TaxID=13451 RepID=UPI00286A501D|nr:regulator of telomere elongation helicase 1 homolog [Corylus avellana]XP_059458901.1 regulator of telomere elongation helicase 1 homolog [Corylus avellana]